MWTCLAELLWFTIATGWGLVRSDKTLAERSNCRFRPSVWRFCEHVRARTDQQLILRARSGLDAGRRHRARRSQCPCWWRCLVGSRSRFRSAGSRTASTGVSCWPRSALALRAPPPPFIYGNIRVARSERSPLRIVFAENEPEGARTESSGDGEMKYRRATIVADEWPGECGSYDE